MTPKALGSLIWKAIESWSKDDVPRLGASIAYYTLFAFAPILIIAIAIAGSVFGTDAARAAVVEQMQTLMGPQGAQGVLALLEGADKPGSGRLAVALGSGWFLLAASGAFYELQHALNRVFRVEADPAKSQYLAFVKNRLRSFAMVLSIGFLLLVSLTLNAALAAAAQWAHGSDAAIWRVVDIGVSLVVVAALFALIYRFLPNVRLKWRDLVLGASLTSLLFTAGRVVLGTYLGHSAWATTYGVVGAVLVLILWIYYSAQLALFGAELTRVFAEYRRGAEPTPDQFAKRDVAAHPKARKATRARRRKRTATNA